MKRLGATPRRVLALGAGLLLAGLCYAALIRPVLEGHRHYDERIAELRKRLAQDRILAEGRSEMQRALEQRKRSAQAGRYYLAERNAALASAELQGLVKRAVEQGGGELISTQVQPGQRSGAISELTVKVRMRGDTRALQRTLHALEAGTPLLFVGNLTIDSGAIARTSSRAAAAARDLSIGLEVSGYIRERQE